MSSLSTLEGGDGSSANEVAAASGFWTPSTRRGTTCALRELVQAIKNVCLADVAALHEAALVRFFAGIFADVKKDINSDINS